MKLNLFLLVCLTGFVPDAVSILRTVPHKYDLMMTPLTWPAARNYCRVKYTDIAAMLSDTDWLRLKNVAANKRLPAPAWVGLYNDIDSWRWSLNNLPLKNVTYNNWSTNQPNNSGGNEACGLIGLDNKWYDAECTLLRPFICYNANLSDADKFIGISRPQLTWLEAQTYCQTHYTDLASSLNSSDQNMLEQVSNSQGDSWFGLYRDAWKWSDGTIASNLQWAPGQPDNAGGFENCAVVYNGLLDVSCTIMHYFFCHTISPMRSQIIKLQVKSNGSVFDPAMPWSILEQIKQKLKRNGMLENTTVTYKVQLNGNIFHKKNDDL